jgi:hypothetical protein
MREVERLLGHGGWDLDDAQARHRAAPDTFWLPPAEQLARLDLGSSVRLTFKVLDQADPVRDREEPYRADGRPRLTLQFERMWLWVERIEGDELVGILKNVPYASHTRLVPGARVRFRRTDVIDLDLDGADAQEELEAMRRCGFPVLDEAAVFAPEDPARPPSIAPSQAKACQRAGCRPERPWPFALLLLGKDVQPNRFPVYGVRARPRPDRRDCGWAIWSGDPDLERASRKHGFKRAEVQKVAERHRLAWEHLALAPGWTFVLGPDGYEDVYLDEAALEESD